MSLDRFGTFCASLLMCEMDLRMYSRPSQYSSAFLVILVAFAAACSNDGPSKGKGDTSCVRGKVSECPCPGESPATQVCTADGIWGACGCGDAGWDVGEDVAFDIGYDVPQDTDRRDVVYRDVYDDVYRDVWEDDISYRDVYDDVNELDVGFVDVSFPDVGTDVGVDFGTDMGNMTPSRDCNSANPPMRCFQDPATFNWGPASVVDHMEIAADNMCCFDFTRRRGAR